MSSVIELTAFAYSSVLSHLVNTEESRNAIVDELYSEPSALRSEFNRFMDVYLEKLEELVGRVKVVERPTREKIKELNYLPFVIIGSTVELEEVNSGDTQKMRVVSPYDASISQNDLSYVSELGRNLILKETGAVIETDMDGNKTEYRIKSIRYEL